MSKPTVVSIVAVAVDGKTAGILGVGDVDKDTATDTAGTGRVDRRMS
jgi:hypothetical protein